MNGISRYCSSPARQAAASKGFFSTGSRITLSPTLLTRTSVPSKRNSLGRRTAWLRPCLNILAVALMTRFLGHVDRYLWYISCNQRVGQHREPAQSRLLPQPRPSKRLDVAIAHLVVLERHFLGDPF